MKGSYRPRLLLIIVCALIVGQIFVVTTLKQEFEKQIVQCQQAVNTQTVLQGALVNLLVEKKIVERNDLLNEARKISARFMDLAGEPPPFDTTQMLPAHNDDKTKQP